MKLGGEMDLNSLVTGIPCVHCLQRKQRLAVNCNLIGGPGVGENQVWPIETGMADSRD